MRQLIATIAVLSLAGLVLSGCATAVVGGITLGEITTAAGIASVGATGKGLPDHALSAMTGKDCRVLEGIVRRNRQICEEPGSPATAEDFHGVVALLHQEESDPQTEVFVPSASTFDGAPVLTRTERQTRRQAIDPASPVQLATPDAMSTHGAGGGPTDLPTMSELASLQPAPELIPSRWTSN